MKFQLNDYSSQLAVLNAIAFMPEWGKTATSAAIDSVVSNMFTTETGDRPGVPNYLIIITGGFTLVILKRIELSHANIYLAQQVRSRLSSTKQPPVIGYRTKQKKILRTKTTTHGRLNFAI